MKSTIYYVSSINGSNSNDGLSEQTPFETLNKINEISLNPGDKVLLEKGSVFASQFLHIKECGDINGEIIEIASYGEGEEMPRIDADGKGIWYQDYGLPLDFKGHIYKGDVSSTVLLYEYNFICTCFNRSYVRSCWRNSYGARF